MLNTSQYGEVMVDAKLCFFHSLAVFAPMEHSRRRENCDLILSQLQFEVSIHILKTESLVNDDESAMDLLWGSLKTVRASAVSLDKGVPSDC